MANDPTIELRVPDGSEDLEALTGSSYCSRTITLDLEELRTAHGLDHCIDVLGVDDLCHTLIVAGFV